GFEVVDHQLVLAAARGLLGAMLLLERLLDLLYLGLGGLAELFLELEFLRQRLELACLFGQTGFGPGLQGERLRPELVELGGELRDLAVAFAEVGRSLLV